MGNLSNYQIWRCHKVKNREKWPENDHDKKKKKKKMRISPLKRKKEKKRTTHVARATKNPLFNTHKYYTRDDPNPPRSSESRSTRTRYWDSRVYVTFVTGD